MYDVNDASSRGKEETWAGNSECLHKIVRSGEIRASYVKAGQELEVPSVHKS